jgi:hypothetical protein
MAANSRPSLDVLVPLVMVENNITNDNSDNLLCEPQKGLIWEFFVFFNYKNRFISEVLRHFESGDIVLVRLDSQCLPAIVFNVSGLVMKFDSKIKRND